MGVIEQFQAAAAALLEDRANLAQQVIDLTAERNALQAKYDALVAAVDVAHDVAHPATTP